MARQKLRGVSQELWQHAFSTLVAHKQMIAAARGVPVGEVQMPEKPWDMELPLEKVLMKTSANRVSVRDPRIEAQWERQRIRPSKKVVRIPSPPSGRLSSRDPLVRTLRGKLLPWVWGAKDEGMEGLLGIPAVEFRAWISGQFREGMSWANHGYWHLDHVRPVASFDHADPEQVKQCWHYTNFQPLWGRENSKKGKSYAKKEEIRRRDSQVA